MRIRSAIIFYGLGAIASCVPISCVPIDGGAIEASWVLRTFDGRAISGCACSEPRIARVRFVVNAVDEQGMVKEDVCAGRASCEFTCTSQRGATPFFVPEGRYAISLAALDASGAVIPSTGNKGGIRVQAPILRKVVHGQPTQFEAFAIEASCAGGPGGCGGDDTTRACSQD